MSDFYLNRDRVKKFILEQCSEGIALYSARQY